MGFNSRFKGLRNEKSKMNCYNRCISYIITLTIIIIIIIIIIMKI